MRTHPALSTSNRLYAVGLVRAFGGAIIFGLPLLMTLEMWALGFYAQPARLLLFLGLDFLILIGLSRFGGFERTANMFEDVLDALAAIGVAILASTIILALFGVLTAEMELGEIVGKVAIQSVPGSFGAMLARKQLSGGETAEDSIQAGRTGGHGSELFLMLSGALFLAFNVAPTEEIILIGFKQTPWLGLLLVLVSITLLHLFVYGVGFAGQHDRPEGAGMVWTFFGYTIAGYGIALIVCLYVLWTFGRTDGAAISQIAFAAAVLGLPASIGAAIARLVI